MTRMTSQEARAIAAAYGFDPRADFHTLPSDKVEAVLRAADIVKYRAPKNRNGSRARYFHAYVARSIAREDS